MNHADLLGQIAEFAERELRPNAREFELAEALPRELITRMAELGYLAPSLPVEYGGLGLDPPHYGQVIEIVGKACNSVRELITVHDGLVGQTLLRFGTKLQKSTWLPRIARGEVIAAFALSEPNIGSDAASLETTFVRLEGQYVIHGIKKWISFADIAGVFLVFARGVDDGKVSAFLVPRDTPGVSTRRITGLLASKASHIAEVALENVVVPAENLVGPPGGGFTYVASYALDHGRHSIAWGGVAIAQAVLDAMVRYARTRSQFGKKLGELDLVQATIGDVSAKVQAIRALCQNAARLRANKESRAIIETTMAKYLSSRIAMEVATLGVQLHGGNGFTNQYPVERYFREAKLLEIIEGTTQILSMLIGQHALLNSDRGQP